MARTKVEAMRNVMREIVKHFGLSGSGSSAWCEIRGEVGARISVSVPVRRRAKVEVMAMMETCVAALLEGGGSKGGE